MSLAENVRANARNAALASGRVAEVFRLREALDEPDELPPPPRKKRVPKIAALPKHVVIPDTQIGPGVPTVHLEWIGQFIADEYAGDDLTIIHLGDHWDMPSLSSYDRGKGPMEGRRIVEDIRAGNRGFALLDAPISAVPKWEPRKVVLRGNHENRITRAVEENAQIEGLLSLDLLNTLDWEVHGFLDVVDIDGVAYSHYFYNPMTGRPYGGQNIDTRLKTIGHSFTMGHQQGLGYGLRDVLGQMHQGLVCGSAYLHEEAYKGPQGNAHWRGIVVCNQVENGSYDPSFISLDYLCRRYEGLRVSEFLERQG